MTNQTTQKAPPIPDSLVAYLDSTFPEKTPRPDWTEREIWMRAGERRLVEHLQALAASQREGTEN